MRRLLKLALAFIALALIGSGWYIYPVVQAGSAYVAKIICSAIFLSGRAPEVILAEDVGAESLKKLTVFKTTIDRENKSVTASLAGLFPRTAVFRPGIGATLALEVSAESLRNEPPPLPPPPPPPSGLSWPAGETIGLLAMPAGLDATALSGIVRSAFDEPDPLALRRARAVVIVYDGNIVAEKYAPGISATTPLAGWSMAKSATNALIGILIRDGKLALENGHLFPAWSGENDPRSSITLDDLLRMSSGLAFNEDYKDPRQDVTTMLFRSPSAAAFAAAKGLEAPPGTRWEYASGSTNILSQIIRHTINDDRTYHAFPYRELFHRIGMHTAIMERDASGTFVGSSFMYASARDWARLGLLFANDGVWDGERILPEGWVEYSITPAPSSTKRNYGAHLWLQPPTPENSQKIFYFSGHEGQYVTIVPEKKLIVVRLGLTLQRSAWNQREFVSRVLKTLPD